MRLDSYHPTIQFIYFVAAIAATICFNHPVFLVLSYLAVFLYSIKLNGVRQLVVNICLFPLVFVYAGYYAFYHHFGITALWSNFIDNSITLEAFIYGITIGIRIAAVFMWCSCIFTIVSTDKIIYLFGRISPKLSLFLSIILRSVPRIGIRAKKIALAREGIGKGCRKGNIFLRVWHLFGMISILVTWTLEDFLESAASMKSRGYSLKGRSAFSIYRFDYRDRGVVITMFACLTVLFMAILLDQTKIYYDPVIVIHRITPMSVVFYLVYGVFLLLPMGLQSVGEWRFNRINGKKYGYFEVYMVK
ncbi:MAG: hypothetical protein J6A75_02215 [Lachnospiraceae bacterium]|nr:hypothetical protein [Lachnospiraceae bacterium]